MDDIYHWHAKADVVINGKVWIERLLGAWYAYFSVLKHERFTEGIIWQ